MSVTDPGLPTGATNSTVSGHLATRAPRLEDAEVSAPGGVHPRRIGRGEGRVEAAPGRR